MYAEVAFLLVSSGTQVQPQTILDPDYLADYPSVYYGYAITKKHYLNNPKLKLFTLNFLEQGVLKICPTVLYRL